jgi:hypothetical protein
MREIPLAFLGRFGTAPSSIFVFAGRSAMRIKLKNPALNRRRNGRDQ